MNVGVNRICMDQEASVDTQGSEPDIASTRKT